MDYYDILFAKKLSGGGGGSSDPVPVLLSKLSITANTGQTAYIEYPTSASVRGGGIYMDGTHSLRSGSGTGSESYFYPIPVPSGAKGVKITSNDLDVGCSEYTDATEWVRSTSSGWMLKSTSASHTYMFTQNPTHITMAFRQAGYTSGGNVTQKMMHDIIFEWVK